MREALRYKGRSEPNGWLGQWRYYDTYMKYVPHLFVYLKKYLHLMIFLFVEGKMSLELPDGQIVKI